MIAANKLLVVIEEGPGFYSVGRYHCPQNALESFFRRGDASGHGIAIEKVTLPVLTSYSPFPAW
jgi:hypothetical protein